MSKFGTIFFVAFQNKKNTRLLFILRPTYFRICCW